MGSRYSLIRIVRTLRKAINGISNYQFDLEINYTSTVKGKYVIVAYVARGINEMVRSEFVDLPELNVSNFRRLPSITEVTYLSDIDDLLRNQLKDRLTGYTELVSIEAFEPYFSFTYRNKLGSRITIILLYNIIKQTINVIDVSEVVPRPV